MRLGRPIALVLALAVGVSLGTVAHAGEPDATLFDLTLDTLRRVAKRPAAGRLYLSPRPQAAAQEKLYPYRGVLLLVSTSPSTPVEKASVQRAAPARAGVALDGAYAYDARTKHFTFTVTERGGLTSKDADSLGRDIARFLFRNPHVDVVLADSAQRADFETFLEREKKAHLLDFLDDAAAFIAKPTMPAWERLWSTYLDRKASRPIELHESARKQLEDLRADIRKREPSLTSGWALDRVKETRHTVHTQVEDLHGRWTSEAEVEAAAKAHISIAGL